MLLNVGGKNTLWHRYWIEFDLEGWTGIRSPLEVCFGVTAYDTADALRLIQERILHGEALPAVRSVIEDVDVSTLEPNHVRINIGVTIWRGIWYPNLSC